jgi:organic radical activating enzyme
MAKEYLYSEIFNSIQGEGHYTGVPTAWIRFFLCNLQCNGFGQDNPTDPDSWDLPYEKIDLKDVTRVEDLPVFEKGCDSSYTWAKKYKHLMSKGTPEELADRIVNILKTDSNPDGLFRHPVSGQTSHLCFTGGEPLTPNTQDCIVNILNHLKVMPGYSIEWEQKKFTKAGNLPAGITFETNGTKALKDEIYNYFANRGTFNGIDLFFSVSPKLWTVAGEDPKRAIKPDVVAQYWELSNRIARNTGSDPNFIPQGQLKFVVGPHKEQWEEMEDVISQFRSAGVKWPVWIMPTGARVEEQEMVAGDVAKMAFERGYNVSARVHTYLFGNAIGT